MTTCTAIVVAAGRGQRFGGEVPKQYADLGGAPVLRHTLIALADHPDIGSVVPVIHPDDRDLYLEASESLDIRPPVIGGDTRQQSVLRGLESLAKDAPDSVLIHDGARPHLGNGVVDRVLEALNSGASGAIPVLPVAETLKRVDAHSAITETVSRDGVVRAQTPQGFSFAPLLAAHQACAAESFTDDAAVLEQCGHVVTTVKGHPDNIKVTETSDLQIIADALYETRTGSGFDVHRFGPGNELVLGGIAIPFERSLLGHSDADVVLHAATDAILGALSDGDIGVHFPPTDAAHKDAPSDVFLAFAVNRLTERFGRLIHLDLTVICEQPKLSHYRDAMRQRIAEISSVPPNRISVKATTTEGLGFTGRGEGIACQATATVRVIPTL